MNSCDQKYRAETTKYMSKREKSEASKKKKHYRRHPEGNLQKNVAVFDYSTGRPLDGSPNGSSKGSPKGSSKGSPVRIFADSKWKNSSYCFSPIIGTTSKSCAVSSPPSSTSSRTSGGTSENVSTSIFGNNVCVFQERKRKQKELVDKFRALGY